MQIFFFSFLVALYISDILTEAPKKSVISIKRSVKDKSDGEVLLHILDLYKINQGVFFNVSTYNESRNSS